MYLPEDVVFILQKLNEKNYEAYIVGGCVRDCLLGIKPKDWDITTSALPLEVKDCFLHTFDTGIQHGTVTVVLHKVNYEVTTYRIDGDYGDGRHPDHVSFTSDLQEDLRRRDFTMNAIAYHPREGIIDPFHGKEDIGAKCIRGVGNAAERFQEDALRMLRAVRFAAQLGFGVEQKTFQAIQENCPLIQKVSAERIREELQKLLLSKYVEQLPLLWKSGLLGQILPQLVQHYPIHENELVSQLKRCRKNNVLVWTLLLQFLSKQETESVLKKLRLDTKTIRSVVLLQEKLQEPLPETPYEIRKMASQIGASHLAQLIALKELTDSAAPVKKVKELYEDILQRQDPLSISELMINGNDLMALGVANGREVGAMLSAALDMVLREPDKNDPSVLKDFVIKRIH